MSLTNTAEVLAGLRSKHSEFVRTPKRGASANKQVYRSPLRWGRLGLEVVYLGYFCWAIVYAFTWSLWGAMPFLAMYAVGFAAVSLRSGLEIVRPGLRGALATQRSQA